jgi:hypothetical protein
LPFLPTYRLHPLSSSDYYSIFTPRHIPDRI